MTTNHPVTYRTLTRKDYPALEAFMDSLYKTKDEPQRVSQRLLNRLYLYDMLSRHTYARVACLGSRIAGLIVGRCTTDQPRHPQRQTTGAPRHPGACLRLSGSWLRRPGPRLRHPMLWLRRSFYLAALLLCRQGPSCARAYRTFIQTDRQLLQSCPEPFEGELLFIAVAPQLRHQGIGLTLLGGFHKYMLSHGARQIYLFTDSGCCFSFYDRLRFDRLRTCYWQKNAPKTDFAFYLYKFSYF